MARRIVKFDAQDGRKPTRSEDPGKPFLLKLPFPVKLGARRTQAFNLGVSCNLPVLVTRKGKTELFAPGEKIFVTLTADVDPLILGDGEIVARAFPIDSSGLDVAE